VTHNIAEAIFLSDQIAVIGRGVVHKLIANPLPRPREQASRSTLPFAEMFGLVAAAMEGAAG
jgi:ABC-type nitrate/sulfonate/bicarbonate transport system ATPase subunit